MKTSKGEARRGEVGLWLVEKMIYHRCYEAQGGLRAAGKHTSTARCKYCVYLRCKPLARLATGWRLAGWQAN